MLKPYRIYLSNLLMAVFALQFVFGCATLHPDHVENVCQIFYQYPKWYWAASDAETKWGVPIAVMMSVMDQESSFEASARPARKKIFWIIRGKRPTSAYGYCQALNDTWKIYQHQTGNYSAKRNSFANSIDFIGWYLHFIHLKLNIPVGDAYHLYLAYHEGSGNYLHGTYLGKPWLLPVAAKVKYRAWAYQAQLNKCRADLKRKPWYHLW